MGLFAEGYFLMEGVRGRVCCCVPDDMQIVVDCEWNNVL